MGDRWNFDFIPECYIDTNVVETLLNVTKRGSKGVNHHHSCTKVANVMQGTFGDAFAVGNIDNDTHSINYIKEFDEINRSAHVILLKHKVKSHYIILIDKAIEDFILSCAKEVGVSVADYGFSSDMKEFTAVTKKSNSQADIDFKRLFKDLEKKNTEMRILSNVLNHLYEKRFEADSETLKSFFTAVLS